MKFNLFALSAIALCLLQQIQANVQPQTGSDLTSTSVQNGPGKKTQTLTAPATSGDTTATAGEQNSDLGLDFVGLSKRDGLGDLVENLLGGVDLLNDDDAILGNLDLVNLGDLIGDLLEQVEGLLGDDGLLETVGGLLQQVINVVECLLKEILRLLGVADVDGLGLEDLIGKVKGILGESDGLDVLNGEVLDLSVVKNLLQTVKGLLGGAGDDKLAGGILKNVLGIVSNLLKGLGLDGVTDNVGAIGNKRSMLRRALVKRAIARRAAF